MSEALINKFFSGELTEFESERLERFINTQDGSAKMLEAAEAHFAVMEARRARFFLVRWLEDGSAWFVRALAVNIRELSLAAKMTIAATGGAAAAAMLLITLVGQQSDRSMPVVKSAHPQIAMARKAQVEKTVVAEKKAVRPASRQGAAVPQREEGEPFLVQPVSEDSVIHDDLTVEVRLEEQRNVMVLILDGEGKLAQTVHTGDLPEGTWFFFLDKKDPRWRDMAPGAYSVEVNVGQRMTRKSFDVGAHIRHRVSEI